LDLKGDFVLVALDSDIVGKSNVLVQAVHDPGFLKWHSGFHSLENKTLFASERDICEDGLLGAVVYRLGFSDTLVPGGAVVEVGGVFEHAVDAQNDHENQQNRVDDLERFDQFSTWDQEAKGNQAQEDHETKGRHSGTRQLVGNLRVRGGVEKPADTNYEQQETGSDQNAFEEQDSFIYGVFSLWV